MHGLFLECEMLLICLDYFSERYELDLWAI